MFLNVLVMCSVSTVMASELVSKLKVDYRLFVGTTGKDRQVNVSQKVKSASIYTLVTHCTTVSKLRQVPVIIFTRPK